MIKESMEAIKSAEAAAEDTIKAANEKALEMVNSAKKKAETDYENAKIRQREGSLEKSKTAETKGEQKAGEIRQETQSQKEKLASEVKSKEAEAVKLAVREITNF